MIKVKIITPRLRSKCNVKDTIYSLLTYLLLFVVMGLVLYGLPISAKNLKSIMTAGYHALVKKSKEKKDPHRTNKSNNRRPNLEYIYIYETLQYVLFFLMQRSGNYWCIYRELTNKIRYAMICHHVFYE